jgi:phosphate:Na+ symporter
MLFNISLLGIDIQPWKEHPQFQVLNLERKFFDLTSDEVYTLLKSHQGEIQSFYLQLRGKLNEARSAELNQLVTAARSAMHSAKSMRDVAANISNLSKSSKDIKYNLFLQQREKTELLYQKLYALITTKSAMEEEELHNIFNEIQDNYTSTLNKFYKEAQQTPLISLDITTAINFNRELYTSNKAMLMAVKDFLLTEKDAVHFNHIVYQS